jgi:aryl-alcohol dehydrogenase-like predicted oxidoreductase
MANLVAAGKHVTPAQLALGWVLTRGQDIATIPGTTRVRHLEDNLGACNSTSAPRS